MNILFFCQSVLISDPIVSDTISRVETFSKHNKVNSIDVVCLRGTRETLPNNIQVFPIQPKNRNRIITFLRLLKTLIKICSNKKIDVVYIYMAPTTAPIFYLLKPIFRYKVVCWFGHATYTPITKLSLLYFTDVWLNSNESMTPFHPKHLRFIGQGTDNTLFYPEHTPKQFDLITVGRITPTKKLELIIDSIKYCKDTFNKTYSLAICGDSYVEQDKQYKNKLSNYISSKGLEQQITFLGMVEREDLRAKLNTAKAFILASPGGVGKSTVEAMACGLPLILPSPEAVDFFTPDLSQAFLCSPEVISLGSKIHECLTRDDVEANKILTESLSLFKARYSLKSFVDRAINAIET